MSTPPIAVVGATGHTGRFVAAELHRRKLPAILIGRDAGKLAALRALHPDAEHRVADSADPAALARALAGAGVVLHCAGPFLDTAPPVLAAALRARIPYLDVAAEQGAAQTIFQDYDAPARDVGIAIIPAMAFYGGLADLLATAIFTGDAEAITTAVALDSWHPTEGTRRTGQRNTLRRLIVDNHALAPLPDPAPRRSHAFPAPFGTQDVVMLPLTEVITIARHLRAAHIASYMNLAPLADLRDASTPAPVAADDRGRSAQQFLVEVAVQRGPEVRIARATGRDIYAITAPLIVEAATRVLAQPPRPGALAPGEAFDARDFLAALDDLAVTYA